MGSPKTGTKRKQIHGTLDCWRSEDDHRQRLLQIEKPSWINPTPYLNSINLFIFHPLLVCFFYLINLQGLVRPLIDWLHSKEDAINFAAVQEVRFANLQLDWIQVMNPKQFWKDIKLSSSSRNRKHWVGDGSTSSVMSLKRKVLVEKEAADQEWVKARVEGLERVEWRKVLVEEEAADQEWVKALEKKVDKDLGKRRNQWKSDQEKNCRVKEQGK